MEARVVRFFCSSKFRLAGENVGEASFLDSVTLGFEYSLVVDPFPPRDRLFLVSVFLFVIRHRHLYKFDVWEYVHEVKAVAKGILEAKKATNLVGMGQAVKSR